MIVFIDIETIASQATDALASVRSALKPPATLKKPETIAAWWATEADQVAEEAHRKQALDGGNQGEIISIACATDADQTWVGCRQHGEPESGLLKAFGITVQGWLDAAAVTGPDGRAWPIGEPYFVAHNAAFDLGFLWRRCIVNQVRLPFHLPPPSARAGKDYACTMLAWAGYGNRIGLDALCKALGLASPKGSLDGSQVYDAWLACQYERIEQYNLADTVAVREVWHRLHGGRA